MKSLSAAGCLRANGWVRLDLVTGAGRSGFGSRIWLIRPRPQGRPRSMADGSTYDADSCWPRHGRRTTDRRMLPMVSRMTGAATEPRTVRRRASTVDFGKLLREICLANRIVTHGEA